MSILNYSGTYTDQYQLAMAQVYYLKGMQNQTAVFDYSFRKLPFKGGYAVFAGLEDLLDILANFRFDDQDLAYLQAQGMHPDFLTFLRNFQFNGNVYSTMEGNLIFPTSPVMTIEADMIEAQLIETVLLNILNFQTLIATKAQRIRQVAEHRTLAEFGLRRAQGPGGYYASRAAIIGGFDATSNVRAGRDYHIPVFGTMAHSFVQSYDSELSAFRNFAAVWPDHCVLLVDTYNTLKSGIPNAIQIAKEMEQQGQRLHGIRLDSGDLAYLAKKARQMLDDSGLDYVQVIVSNQLNEDIIKSLLEQGAPIDTFGVGTSIAIGAPDAALDGVYKLAFANNKPRLKLSEEITKITLPDRKQVYRVVDNQGVFIGADVVTLAQEKKVDTMYHFFDSTKQFAIKNYQHEPMLHLVMEQGKRLNTPQIPQEISQYRQQQFDKLPAEYKRFTNPHHYKVGLSKQLKSKRDQLIIDHQGRND